MEWSHKLAQICEYLALTERATTESRLYLKEMVVADKGGAGGRGRVLGSKEALHHFPTKNLIENNH